MKEKEWCYFKRAVHVYGLTLTGFLFWTGFRAPINKEGAPQNGQKMNKLESNKMFLN